MFYKILIILLFATNLFGQTLTPSNNALNPADFTGKYIYSDGTSFIPKSKSEILGYTTYMANLYSVDTNITATVFMNELGTVTITRLSAGVYSISKGSAFDINKTYVSLGVRDATNIQATEPPYAVSLYFPMWFIDDENYDGTYNLIITTAFLDGVLVSTPIEIRIIP